ncbi:hypothetical protein HELRODRAFT_187943 [Helobdella robusta]|uniref:Pre-SET domain-containing protein n=1 Tax=Helobdella robusta TaxID=6412 RepID=T1FPH6_HELRO|nr:hypothetical protein HELRODRAFT_187943 [Helobdella robusta]ESO12649.1 hypothetical protein HELRODRAFT_187943 [Helobdella robusta]
MDMELNDEDDVDLFYLQDIHNDDELKDFIKSSLTKLMLENQLTDIYSSSIIGEELRKLREDAKQISETFSDCQELIRPGRDLKNRLVFNCSVFKPGCSDDEDVMLIGDNLHNMASGELVKFSKVFAHKVTDCWKEGILFDIVNPNSSLPQRVYLVRFGDIKMHSFTSKNIAFGEVPQHLMAVGTRVIALYRDISVVNFWYAGVVAEGPSRTNFFRYLVFFDDGYAQYCAVCDIRQVYDQSKFVWEDVRTSNSQFIKEYLQVFPNRPMVHLKQGHIIKAEQNGVWMTSSVLEVDASLVKLLFVESKQAEWIYRGSRRLEPLYRELAKAEASQKIGRGPRFSTMQKMNKKGAYVVYTVLDDDDPTSKGIEMIDLDPNVDEWEKSKESLQPQESDKHVLRQRSVETTSILDDSSLTNKISTVVQPSYRMTDSCIRCRPACIIEGGDDPKNHRGVNPYLIPLLCGWDRQVSKPGNFKKKMVTYRSHCGRLFRSIDEVDGGLTQMDSLLTIDLFSFDVKLSTDVEFDVVKNNCTVEDFSQGKEPVAVSCVNSLDEQRPDQIEYSTERIPGRGVNLNTDPSFLVGCDCTDNCRDRSKCKCIQLTVEATGCLPGNKNNKAGYSHRRLKQPIITAIYECNSRCSCDSRCRNRVIQNGLSLRLQIFKTEKKGWGLRCLDDIPAGRFICVYSGQVLTEDSANEDGKLYGDEYLADLDHIDVVEREKEGYESDVIKDDDDEEEEEECDTDLMKNSNVSVFSFFISVV